MSFAPYPPVAQESAPIVQGPMPPDAGPMTIPQACQQLMGLIEAQQGRLTVEDQQAVMLLQGFFQQQSQMYGAGDQSQMTPDQSQPFQAGPVEDQFSHAGSPKNNMAPVS